MSKANNGYKSFATLDAMRWVAATFVFLAHAEKFSGVNVFSLFAVDIFFMMSGFVIAYAYEIRWRTGEKASRFLLIRWIRLYPLYLSSILIGFAVHVGLGDMTLPVATRTLFWSIVGLPTPGAQEDLLYPLNPAAWSLFFEVLVNGIYVLTWRYWTKRNLLLWLPLSVVVLMVARVHFHQFDIGWSWGNELGGAARVAFGFPLGVLIYRYWQSGAFRKPLVPSSVVVLATAVILYWEPPFRVLEVPLLIVIAPILVSLGVADEPPVSWRNAWTAAGTVSYAIYTLHSSVLLIARNYLPPGVWSGVATLCAVMLVSHAASALYDMPVRKWLGGRLLRAKSRTLPAHAET